eukprot:11045371-Heterocapsa_arctica.AAC.1
MSGLQGLYVLREDHHMRIFLGSRGHPPSTRALRVDAREDLTSLVAEAFGVHSQRVVHLAVLSVTISMLSFVAVLPATLLF